MTANDGMVLNTYYVLELEGNPIGDAQRLEEIRSALERELSNARSRDIQVPRRLPRQHRYFPTATAVSFSTDEPNQRTIMRLVTLDRPGLLAEVGAAFDACGIRLQNAKIATVGAEVEDVFFITTEDRTPVTRSETLSCIREEIRRRLEPANAA
jgi:[protein-PII] uridylyltransferase